MRESEVQKQILEYLRWKGKAYKLHTTGIPDAKSKSGYRKNPSKGIFDIYFIAKDGRTMWFEVKAKGGRLSDEQVDFQTAHAKSTVKTHVVYDLPIVENIVDNKTITNHKKWGGNEIEKF